ncbi:MAG TPA: hypothetical protein VFN23_10535 [Ktedonobacteraceae bacterium]|nr:hypothetical protein [Ktedonobacteraceae bacterium]
MSGFGKTPTTTTEGSLATNQVFISSVAVPGHANGDLTALRGANASVDANGNELADVSAAMADGANVTLGSIGDAAWSGSGNGTAIAILKKLEALLAGTLGISGVVVASGAVTANAGANLNTSALALESGGNLATIASNTATPNISDRWARQLGQIDLARVLGAALSNTNPVPTESNIQNWLRNGQAFVVSTGLVTGASATCGLSIWNGTSGKNILIYSICFLDQQGGQGQVGQIYKLTANPGLANVATPVNKNFGSATTSSMTCTSANSGVNLSGGTLLESFPTNSPAVVELIQPGSGYFLPGNVNSGLGVQVAMQGTGGFVQVSVHYVEF